MQHFHPRPSFLRLGALFAVCGAASFLATPSQAQTGENFDPTSLSDVAGPFHGNIPPGVAPIFPPPAVSTSITTLDNTTRVLISSPESPNIGRVVKVCVDLSSSMAKVAPFSGCTDIKWKEYNRAVADAKQLNRELAHEAQVQSAALGANPSPEQRTAILQRLNLLDTTTTALEITTEALTLLGKAIDKAR